jgi:hypothetical protein
MTTLTVVNESKIAKNADVFVLSGALSIFAQQVCTAWGLPPLTVSYALKRGTGWNICIVDQFPNPAMATTAYGYHEIVNGQPIAYVRQNSFGSRSPFGFYLAARVIMGRQITPQITTPGIASVAMHEVAEMIVDPNINQFAKDSLGRNWLMEICDHTTGNYAINFAKTNIVAPDFTTPSFYKTDGKGPYSYLNTPKAPFTLVKGAYGYYQNSAGAITALNAATAALDKA